MSNKVFQQNLDDKKGPKPEAPNLIKSWLKKPGPMRTKRKILPERGKKTGQQGASCFVKKLLALPALVILAEFRAGRFRYR